MSYHSETEPYTIKYDGVKLHNKQLTNVDPYSDDLTEEQKSSIIEECKVNAPYFLHVIALKKGTPNRCHLGLAKAMLNISKH